MEDPIAHDPVVAPLLLDAAHSALAAVSLAKSARPLGISPNRLEQLLVSHRIAG